MRYWWLLRFFIVFLVSGLLIAAADPGNAGLTIDADRQYDYARSRFDDGAFDEAVVEFNRFVYFFPKDPRSMEANFQIGMAYFNSDRYSDAAIAFDRLTKTPSDDSLITDSYLMLSQSHAHQGMIEQALVDLRNLMMISSDPDVTDRAYYEMGWLFIDQGRWNEADQAFRQINADNQTRFDVADLRQALAQSDQISSKNPTISGFLSIVPGGGQIYCNRYKDALTAFLVNAGLIWAAWEAFDNELYALGGVISFVGFGFYAGNIYGAVSSAHKYNRDRNTEFRDGLIRKKQVSFSLGPVPGGLIFGLKMDF